MPNIDMVTRGGVDEPLGSRIAAVVEPGRRGAAALAQAAALAATSASELTAVAIAPRVATVCRSCGGVSARAYNCAARDEVADELEQAIANLGPIARNIRSELLVEGTDPPLEKWIAHGQFDLVLLPARRRVPRLRSHPSARLLRRLTEADVRVV
jgi:hypothetical protein